MVLSAAGPLAPIHEVATDGDAARAPTARDVVRNLRWYRNGSADPTTRLGDVSMVRAVRTPEGPATVQISWAGAVSVRTWGPGSAWAEPFAWQMTALQQRLPRLHGPSRLVAEASRQHPHIAAGASGDLYHALLPVVLAQRITAGEALRQWHRLALAYGSPAPGPFPQLVLPPSPEVLARVPTWRLHRLGIEQKRAAALMSVARVADQLWDWATLAPADVAVRLSSLPGIGAWTIGSVLGPACGDNDAVPIGDFHFPNTVAWNLAGEPRADDDRMLQLLRPYQGQRGRALRLILLAGQAAPAFGPKRRIIPIEQM